MDIESILLFIIEELRKNDNNQVSIFSYNSNKIFIDYRKSY